MWHIDILQYLARKICNSNQNKAAQFIARFIHLAEQEMEFEVLAILGFVKDLYLYSKKNQNRDVPLSEFARRCIGLFILHAKYSDDYQIYVSDFISLLKDKIIFSALGIQKEVIELNEYLYANGQLKKISPSLFSINFKKLTSATPNKVLLRILLRIEREVFFSLQHKVSLTANDLNQILLPLIYEIKEPYLVITQLIDLLKQFKHREAPLNQFILELEKIEDKLITPTMSEICLQLEEYVSTANQNSNAYANFFYNPENYCINEVLKIIEGIQKKTIRDVDSILKKLFEINISNPNDPLIDKIQTLDAQYKNIVFEV
ncbi:Uncharacterised protein [Legionella wadsworthii]|uniref:Uncharacterized protein n=1 Tax=Legionella wadsworthii TaxID=28088 RepID=A0A378LQX6_9GAMM|nr:hypothetical protein [Legionella wadsworthii]STY29193.1 Uncharacterised protein [Legionella wadsworthii]